MKNNRDLVLDLLRQCTGAVTAAENMGVSTQYLSQRLDLQRSNISSILNTLVKEGLVEKKDGRPVLYRIRQEHERQGENSCFRDFAGACYSMRRAVQLAKAAILYPQHSLHTLLIGLNGVGKGCFAGLMHRFAVETGALPPEAPFIKFNCANYIDDQDKMYRALFGVREDGRTHYMERAEDGILFIDHAQLLPAPARTRLFRFVEDNYQMAEGFKRNLKTMLIVSVDDSASKSIKDIFQGHFTVCIRLLPLEERSLEERFLLIRQFFCVEAECSNKTLTITSEILIALLLYPCEEQIRQLKNDIKIACANAYVREFQSGRDEIQIAMSDFPYGIRVGLLGYKSRKFDLHDIISENSSYVFSPQTEMKRESKECREPECESIYGWIDQKTQELRNRGIAEQDINTIVSIDIEQEFSKYTSRLGKQVVNKEQLSQLVESRIICMVQEFIGEATKAFNRIYPASVFYGLCLHLSATLKGEVQKQKLSNQRIMEIIEKYRGEYSHSIKFISRLEQEYQVHLPIDEVIFVTMFICGGHLEEEDVKRPVVLIAMHGDQVASSVADVVRSLSGSSLYAYDMPLDKKTQEAYEELRDLVMSIHKGRGILAIYDMGSLKEIFEMIGAETGITIKTIEIPLTVLALDCRRKVMLETDIEAVYESVMDKYKNLSLFREAYHRPKSGSTIITLCMSGEGGAIQIKKYLKKHVDLTGVQIIPLSVSDKEQLLKDINEIHEKSHILCTIGSIDPEVLGIPFIPVSQVFQCKPEELRMLLYLDLKMEGEFDENCRLILEHLGEELHHTDMDRLKNMLPDVLHEMEQCYGHFFTVDQKVGLLVHLACCIDRTAAGSDPPANIYKEEILERNKEMYDGLKKCLILVEEAFSISIGEDEYAHIISIILKSKHG